MNRVFKRTIKILSIDGGGIRGLLPALILKDLINRLSGEKNLCNRFDLIAGTSTGSLIALGLTVPKKSKGKNLNIPKYTIDDIIDIYLYKGIKIFPEGIFKQLMTIKHAFVEKYSSSTFDLILSEYFKELTIKESLTNLLITAFDIENQMPFFFKNYIQYIKGKDFPDFYMKDVARASSAAPTYFMPAYVSPIGSEKKYSFVDGGVFANNPAMCAYIEAKKIYPNARKFIILSLGTGVGTRKYSHKQVKDWGYIDWVHPGNGAPLSTMMSRGQSGCVNHQLKKNHDVDFYRINPPLTNCSDALDNADPENLKNISKIAEIAVKDYDDCLTALSKKL